jgi:hypothetical protein
MQFDKLNEKSNKQIIELYFEYIGEANILRALEEFTKKMGFGILDVSCEFACNFKEWEEGYFGESGVEILISEPLVNTDFSKVVSEMELLEGAKQAITKYGLNNQDVDILFKRMDEKFSE